MTRFNQRIAGKIISLAVVLALVFPISLFSAEKKIRSNKATVHVQQTAYKGAMIYVDRDLLVLKERESGELLGFSFPDVERVSIKKSKASIGMLIGLGIGVGLAALLVGSVKKDQENVFAAIFIVPIVLAAAVVTGVVIAAVTSTAGGLIGLLVGKKNFKLGRMSPEKKEAALAKLKKYAVFQVLPDELRSQVVMVPK
jgi:MFS family permease